MPKRFPKITSQAFVQVREEIDYLYEVLDFTLQLDAIEDANPQLIPFLKELISGLASLLKVDETAILVKDFYGQGWLPCISYPEGEAFHKAFDFRNLLNYAEIACDLQEPRLYPLGTQHGGIIVYPLVFQGDSIGVLFLFRSSSKIGIAETDTDEPWQVFAKSQAEYHNLLKLLWYVNELENDAIRERLEISETQSLLGKYISPQLMEKIIQSPVALDLEGQEIEVTILFADLCSFTKLSEKIASKELVRLLNTYWSGIVDIVFRYQGVVDKFIGDCIMVVFNSPLPQEDHYFRAAATALEIQSYMEQMRQLPDFSAYQLEIAIGIHTGRAICGNVGSKQRLEYTVIGNTVNLASRLETLAPRGTTLVSEDFYTEVRGAFLMERGAMVNIKGQTHPIQTYRLVSFLDEETMLEKFLQNDVSVQKNMLVILSLFPILSNPKELCRMLTNCHHDVAMLILNLFEADFCVEVVPALGEWLKKCENPLLISRAVKTVAFLGGPAYLKAILTYLHHPDMRVVANTIEAVGLTGYENVFHTIKPFMNHENHRVRLQACRVSWEMDQDLAFDQFFEALQSPDDYRRKAAIILLTEVNSDEMLWTFMDRYSKLNSEQRRPIRQLVKDYGNKKLQYHMDVTEGNLSQPSLIGASNP